MDLLRTRHSNMIKGLVFILVVVVAWGGFSFCIASIQGFPTGLAVIEMPQRCSGCTGWAACCPATLFNDALSGQSGIPCCEAPCSINGPAIPNSDAKNGQSGTHKIAVELRSVGDSASAAAPSLQSSTFASLNLLPITDAVRSVVLLI